MLVEEFIQYLKGHINKNIVLELKGIIETTIKINQIIVKDINRHLIIQSQNSLNKKIKINLHQLMKIKNLNEKEFLLEFDQLQNINIRIIN